MWWVRYWLDMHARRIAELWMRAERAAKTLNDSESKCYLASSELMNAHALSPETSNLVHVGHCLWHDHFRVLIVTEMSCSLSWCFCFPASTHESDTAYTYQCQRSTLWIVLYCYRGAFEMMVEFHVHWISQVRRQQQSEAAFHTGVSCTVADVVCCKACRCWLYL